MEDIFELEEPPPQGPLKCDCGRFAKFMYRGMNYEGEYSFTVNCSRCGIVTVY